MYRPKLSAPYKKECINNLHKVTTIVSDQYLNFGIYTFQLSKNALKFYHWLEKFLELTILIS